KAGTTTYDLDFAIMLRLADGSVEVFHDRHRLGVFPRDAWREAFISAGFAAPRLRRDPWGLGVFIARPAPPSMPGGSLPANDAILARALASHRHRRAVASAAPLLLVLVGTSAAAHTGSASGGFVGGFAHPIFGPDHVVAMVAVGLW